MTSVRRSAPQPLPDEKAPPRALFSSSKAPPRRGFLFVPARARARRSSIRLGAGELHHPSPLLGLSCDKSAELSRGERHWYAPGLLELGLDRRIGQPRIDLAIEPLDDLAWRPCSHTHT